MSDSNDPFCSLAIQELDLVHGGAERIASAASRNSDVANAVDKIDDLLSDLKDSSGMNPMMMMMMMTMLGRDNGRTIKTGGLLGGTTVSG